jgi:hypothetical protein
MRMWIQMRVGGNEVLSRLPPGLGREVGSALDREMWRRIDREGRLTTRRIDLPADSPVWEQVLGVLTEVHGDPFSHYTAYPSFRYAKNELLQAEVLRLQVTRAFEPAGEECGTTYDECRACPHCGAGRVQVSELHLQLRRQWQALPSLPRTRQFQIARTIADEVIVSRVLADEMESAGLSGVQLRPVYGCGAKAKETPHWRQFRVTGSAGRTVPPTHFGINPFRDDAEGEYRCPLGHVSGLNLLSEVYVPRASWDGTDVTATEDLVGARMGLLVPVPMILISRRFYRLLLETGTKGFRVEVAHLV